MSAALVLYLLGAFLAGEFWKEIHKEDVRKPSAFTKWVISILWPLIACFALFIYATEAIFFHKSS